MPGDLEPILQQLQVTFRYAVYFTTNVFESANLLLRDAIAGGSVVFVVDSGVAYCAAAIESYCSANGIRLAAAPLVIPGGEAAKNDAAVLQSVLAMVNDAGVCRHSYVVAVGGGAVIDVAGYAAAIAHRGVRLIRIPTTVLAQDDAGLGVKNGINYFGKKNYLGTFSPPVAVINDAAFLRTLTDRDWLCGLTEAIKIALIRDGEFFAAIERDADALVARDAEAMQRVIRRCAEMHLAHIVGSGDPFESGSSRPLDFGHWAAHRLEQMTGHGLRHGEAVGIGIALDSAYSFLSEWLGETDCGRIHRLLRRLKLPVYAAEMSLHAELLRGLTEFREHLGGVLTLTMLRGIGAGFEVHEIDEARMIRAIELLSSSWGDSPGALVL